MQSRMKKYPLSDQAVSDLLRDEQVGRLATLGEDGFPYIVPMHFVVIDGVIYMHGLAAGEKLANIKADPRVCFEADRMAALLHADAPCNTNTQYESVVIRGKAFLVEDEALKIAALNAIVAKYTPQHGGVAFPQGSLNMTAVIRLDVTSCTGKYYPKEA